MGAPTGNLELILQALTQADGTCAELGKRCGLPTRAVTNALHDQAKTVNARAFRVDKASNVPVWSLNRPVVKRDARLTVKYVAEFKPLEPENYDLWRGRNLAMYARGE